MKEQTEEKVQVLSVSPESEEGSEKQLLLLLLIPILYIWNIP
jgi:hypothetical protein